MCFKYVVLTCGRQSGFPGSGSGQPRLLQTSGCWLFLGIWEVAPCFLWHLETQWPESWVCPTDCPGAHHDLNCKANLPLPQVLWKQTLAPGALKADTIPGLPSTFPFSLCRAGYGIQSLAQARWPPEWPNLQLSMEVWPQTPTISSSKKTWLKLLRKKAVVSKEFP